MTISANMHRVSAMSAEQRGGTTWLKITGESAVETVSVFMPFEQAARVAAAFNAAPVDTVPDAETAYWLSGQQVAK